MPDPKKIASYERHFGERDVMIWSSFPETTSVSVEKMDDDGVFYEGDSSVVFPFSRTILNPGEGIRVRTGHLGAVVICNPGCRKLLVMDQRREIPFVTDVSSEEPTNYDLPPKGFLRIPKSMNSVFIEIHPDQ